MLRLRLTPDRTQPPNALTRSKRRLRKLSGTQISANILGVADCLRTTASGGTTPSHRSRSRHSFVVRLTHWLTTISFFALLVSGAEILISHPRFYWGETGNVLTPGLFQFPIPASRVTFLTRYSYVLPDQNGWSRYLHFQAAWIAVLTGLLYVAHGLISGHFFHNLFPARTHLSAANFSEVIAGHLRLRLHDEAGASSYNSLQRLTYLFVIFVLFPLVIWTGLAMSPAIVSAFPAVVTILGGQQSARTLHFFVSLSLVLFLLVHVGMVSLAGFRIRMKAMTVGTPPMNKEQLS